MSPAEEARGPVVLWFRRDLRLSDHPALAQAAGQGPVTALFVLDDLLVRTAGQPRLRYFLQTLRALDLQLRAVGGALTVRAGRPERVVPAVATEVQAQGSSHHCRLRPLRAVSATDRVSEGPRPGAVDSHRLAVRRRSWRGREA